MVPRCGLSQNRTICDMLNSALAIREYIQLHIYLCGGRNTKLLVVDQAIVAQPISSGFLRWMGSIDNNRYKHQLLDTSCVITRQYNFLITTTNIIRA